MEAAWLNMFTTALAFTGIILFAAQRFALPFAHAAIASVSSVVLGGFVFALAGLYAIYGRLFIFAGLVLLALRLVEMWRQRESVRLNSSCFPPLLFIACIFFFIWYFNGVKLVYYDEFFWGNLAKDLLHTGGIPEPKGILALSGVPIYPPGPSILQTLFMGRHFSDEGMALGGILTVLLLFFMIFQLAAKHVDQASAFALALIAACIGRCMGTPVNTFAFYRIGYAEYIQGSIFAALLCAALYEKDPRLRNAVLIPGLGLLCLLKATGFLFALGVVVCAAIVLWHENGHEPTGTRLRITAGRAARLTVPVAVVWLAWQWHMNTLDFLHKIYPGITDVTSSISAMLQDRAVSPEMNPAASSAINKAVSAPKFSPLMGDAAMAIARAALKKPLLFSPVFPESVMNILSSTIAIFAQWVLIFFILRKYAGAVLKKYEKRVLLILFAGLFGWVALRLHLALNYHNMAEIMRAASYERYIGAYMAGIAVVTAMMLHIKLAGECTAGAARMARPLLALNLVTILVICGFNPLSRPAELSVSRNLDAMREVAACLEQNTPKGSRIWYMERGAEKEKPWILRFLTEPERHSAMPYNKWNLGAPSEKLQDDTFPDPLPPEKIIHLARSYHIDFILIWKTDKEFLNRYGPTLGLDKCDGPVLLGLSNWLAGKSTHPEAISTCRQIK